MDFNELAAAADALLVVNETGGARPAQVLHFEEEQEKERERKQSLSSADHRKMGAIHSAMNSCACKEQQKLPSNMLLLGGSRAGNASSAAAAATSAATPFLTSIFAMHAKGNKNKNQQKEMKGKVKEDMGKKNNNNDNEVEDGKIVLFAEEASQPVNVVEQRQQQQKLVRDLSSCSSTTYTKITTDSVAATTMTKTTPTKTPPPNNNKNTSPSSSPSSFLLTPPSPYFPLECAPPPPHSPTAATTASAASASPNSSPLLLSPNSATAETTPQFSAAASSSSASPASSSCGCCPPSSPNNNNNTTTNSSEQRRSPSPSMGAATFLSNWRRRQQLQQQQKHAKAVVGENNDSGIINSKTAAPAAVERVESNSSSSGKSSSGSSAGGGCYSLSELSHEVLNQIIRLFPFSSSFASTTSSSSSSSPSIRRSLVQRAKSQPIPSSISCAISPSPATTPTTNLTTEEEEEETPSTEETTTVEGKQSKMQFSSSSSNLRFMDDDSSMRSAGGEERSSSSTQKSSMASKEPAKRHQQRLREWHTKASGSALGRRLRRAASSISGSKFGSASITTTASSPSSTTPSPLLFPKRERPKNLLLFGHKAATKAGENSGALLGSPRCNGALSRLCKVSVDTMAITALPLDCWLKERLKNWVQLSGHQGTIVPASNHSLWKKQPQGSHIEARSYAQIMLDPALRGVTPTFFREIQHKNEVFIEIQDLLAEFPETSTRSIMDIKIGTRTFLESEVANKNKRSDLYRKMVELSADEPTEEERQEGAITKLRYMQFRERKSSSATLGFRIEAAQTPGAVSLQKSCKQLRTRQQVRQALRQFCGSSSSRQNSAIVRSQFAARLRHIRAAVEKSTFFARHEVVGSSVLLIHNACEKNGECKKGQQEQIKAGAWLIDFAKCHRVEGNNNNEGEGEKAEGGEKGRLLTHRLPWELGNHEEGYLTGLDNLVEIFEEEEEEDENEEEEEEKKVEKEVVKYEKGRTELIEIKKGGENAEEKTKKGRKNAEEKVEKGRKKNAAECFNFEEEIASSSPKENAASSIIEGNAAASLKIKIDEERR